MPHPSQIMKKKRDEEARHRPGARGTFGSMAWIENMILHGPDDEKPTIEEG